MSLSEREIYENHVLRHFEEPYHRGRCNYATHRRRVDNPDCGDSVEIELRICADGRIEEMWFQASGCIISQAAASMLAAHAERLMIHDMRAFTPQDMLALFGARLTARRQQCCLLALKALLAAIDSPANSSFGADK